MVNNCCGATRIKLLLVVVVVNLTKSGDISCNKLIRAYILISKNQALQILYLKHHAYKSLWIRNLMKSTKN